MKDLVGLINQSEDLVFLGAIDFSQIVQAEQSLGLCFANDYKEYVLAFGAATFDGHELTGICDSERLSVVSETEHARYFYPQFPKNKYVIENLFMDHILIVQDSTGIVYSYGPIDEARYIAGSLEEYLFMDTGTNSESNANGNVYQ